MRSAMVTVVFSDVVGSTSLATRLGDDEADRVRRSITDIEARAVAHGGGRVVKRLGDGMMAVFTSAAAALDVAVDRPKCRTHRESASPSAMYL